MTKQWDYDAIVVGSGFGGSVSALRLSEKGYKVAVLEQGKRFHAADFPKTNWNLKRFLWLPAARCFGIFRMTLFRDVFVLSGTGVGGGSLVYANTLYVPPDDVFRASQWPQDRDWQSELMPHYRMAQYMLGVTQNPFEGPADHLLKEAAEEMNRGHTYTRTPVAVYFGKADQPTSDPYFGGAGPERTGCNFCGGCMVGCRFGAKNTLDKNYLHFAEKLGCQIFPERTVVGIRALPDGGYEVEHIKTGGFFRKDRKVWRCQKLVLSAGVIGTMTLLFQAKESGGLPHLSESLGDHVRTNSEAVLGIVSKNKQANYSRGIAITSSIYPDEHTHIEVVRYSEGSDALSSISTLLVDGGEGKSRVWGWIKTVARHPGDFLRTLWPFGWAKRGVILLVMQTLDNSLRLQYRRNWLALGRRSIDTDVPDGKGVPAYIPVGNEVARWFGNRMNGIPQSSITEVLFDVPTTAHILGGAVMGSSPEMGVIDTTHQVFGHPGLYICDGSMVPANLGVNPSLTITAMSEYAMSQVPVKEGESYRPAIDPEWTAQCLEERKQQALQTGNPNQHPIPLKIDADEASTISAKKYD